MEQLTPAEQEELARQFLAHALSGGPRTAQALALPRVQKFDVERQWVDELTGDLMASGTVFWEDGSTTEHNGKIRAVFRGGEIIGYTLCKPPTSQIGGNSPNDNDGPPASQAAHDREEDLS